NLAAFVGEDGEWTQDIYRAHQLMTRFLIRATYGDVSDPKQAAVLAEDRRIGVGHLGVASALALKGIKYADAPHDAEFRTDLHRFAQVVDNESITYSHELRIPVPVKKRTVAPTGSIAKLPGVSEGIHPIFSKYFIRRVRFSKLDPDQVKTLAQYEADGYLVEDDQYADNTAVVSIATKDSLLEQVAARYGDEKAEDLVQGANDLEPADMLRFQAMYQSIWADNAVSYTVNFDPLKYSLSDLEVLLRRWGGLIKGATVFPEESRPRSR